MKLTKAETEWLVRERYRINLDFRNWEAEPFITRKQLEEMSAWRAEILMMSTRRWLYDRNAEVLVNQFFAQPQSIPSLTLSRGSLIISTRCDCQRRAQMSSATETVMAAADRERDERALHQRMEWFFKKYAPADKREAAEFHADLTMVVQAVHRDASRETHRLLMAAVAVMPNPFTALHKP